MSFRPATFGFVLIFHRWHVAGRLYDLLTQLHPNPNDPLPSRPQAPSKKRDRIEGDTLISAGFSSSLQDALNPQPPSRSGSGMYQQAPQQSSWSSPVSHHDQVPQYYPQPTTNFMQPSNLVDKHYAQNEYLAPGLIPDFSQVDPEALNMWLNAPVGFA